MTLNRLAETGETYTPARRDTQTTTFSIDAISRFVCNTWDEVMAADPASIDVVVIGSGMYGAYVASKLWEFGSSLGAAAPRVLVLEGGPFLISEHVQNLTGFWPVDQLVNEPVVGPNFQFDLDEPSGNNLAGNFSPHARCIGGKSLFWGGWTPEYTEADLRRADSPWPSEVVDYLFQPGVATDDVDDGYPLINREIGTIPVSDFIKDTMMFQAIKDRAENVFTNVALENGSRLTAVEDPPIAVQAESPLSGLFSFDKYSSLPLLTDAIRNDAAQSNNNDANRRLLLVPNAQVIKLITDQGRVIGVEFVLLDRTRSGVADDPAVDPYSTRFARSKETLFFQQDGASVIIAGNTINSTRLALNSFPRPQSIFGPERMGRNLMYHVRTNHVWQVKRDALGLPVADQNLGNTALNIRGESRHIDGVGRTGQFHFQFYASSGLPPGINNSPEDAELFLYRLLPNFDQVQDVMASHDDEVVALGIRTAGETFGDRFTEIPPPDGTNISWMNLGNADEVFVDESGQEVARTPFAFVKMVETPADAIVRQDQRTCSFRFIEALAGVLGTEDSGGRIEGYQDFLNSNRQTRYRTNSAVENDGIGTTYHECGTLWMGDDPFNSVTDVHGRFHHVTNAYCCDQALFPTAGSANPVPTGIALSRKVARGIIARYEQTDQAPGVESGFQSLFDGTENGWSRAGADNFFLFEENGVPLISAGTETGNPALGVFWHSARQFGDFELRLQWRIFSIIANGGVFLRAPAPDGDLGAPGGFYEQALEVQIDERGFNPNVNAYGGPLHRTGAVYERLPANRWAARIPSPRTGPSNYWNDLSILVQGGHIEVRLNGELVSEGDHGSNLGSGFIGFQCHTEVVQYRSIRIREL